MFSIRMSEGSLRISVNAKIRGGSQYESAPPPQTLSTFLCSPDFRSTSPTTLAGKAGAPPAKIEKVWYRGGQRKTQLYIRLKGR